MKIKKGDTVKVISGKDKGKTGVVVHAYPALQKVLLEGVNMKKRHMRARRAGQKGQLLEKPMPIHVSNVSLIDSTGKTTRVGFSVTGGKKVRIARKSGATI